jgi:hypothetical protein
MIINLAYDCGPEGERKPVRSGFGLIFVRLDLLLLCAAGCCGSGVAAGEALPRRLPQPY